MVLISPRTKLVSLQSFQSLQLLCTLTAPGPVGSSVDGLCVSTPAESQMQRSLSSAPPSDLPSNIHESVTLQLVLDGHAVFSDNPANKTHF